MKKKKKKPYKRTKKLRNTKKKPHRRKLKKTQNKNKTKKYIRNIKFKKVKNKKKLKKNNFNYLRIKKKIKKIKSAFKNHKIFNFSLKKIIEDVGKKFTQLKKDFQNRRERVRKLKIESMSRQKEEAQKKLIEAEQKALRAKEIQLKEEEILEKSRKKELQHFIRLEQAELNKEQAEKQRKVLEQIRLEKKIEKFKQREELEIKKLEKYVLKQQRQSYEEIQIRIKNIKDKYNAIRQQKIFEELRERLIKFGVKVEDNDDKETLLKKEKIFNEEREKVEFALESFYRSAHSLIFQINKRYIPKYLSIMRVIDRRFENGEVLIKWDDTLDEDWFILIYVKKNTNDDIIYIEDKSDPENKITHEFKPTEIFKASDMMVDVVTKLLDSERNKKN